MRAPPETFWDRRLRALRTVGPLAGLVLVPGIVWGFQVVSAPEGTLAIDFHYAFRPAGQALLDGRDPYPALDSPVLDAELGFIYPAFAALLFSLWALVPALAADLGWTALLAVCVLVTPAVLGVRDWRCYAALLWWAPVFAGLQTGNLSIPFMLGVAVVWRLRHRPFVSGITCGAMIATKLFMWPLAVWLMATRRYLAAAVALLAAGLLTVVGFAVVGFEEIEHYRALAERVTDLEAAAAYTPYGLARDLGIGAGPARAVTVAFGLGLLGAGAVLARRSEARALDLAIGAALVLSPMVWLHYLVLLIVPLAHKRPRFDLFWVLPGLLWVVPQGHGLLWQKVLVLAVAAALVMAPCTAEAAGSPAQADRGSRPVRRRRTSVQRRILER